MSEGLARTAAGLLVNAQRKLSCHVRDLTTERWIPIRENGWGFSEWARHASEGGVYDRIKYKWDESQDFPHKTAQNDTISVPEQELSCANINEMAITACRQNTQNHSNTKNCSAARIQIAKVL